MKPGAIRLPPSPGARRPGESVGPRLRRRIRPCYLLPAHSCLPVVLWRGAARASGRQASVLVAGKEPWVCHLPQRFFGGGVRRETICRTPVWRLPGRLQRLGRSADLTILRVSRLAAPLFAEAGCLRVRLTAKGTERPCATLR